MRKVYAMAHSAARACPRFQLLPRNCSEHADLLRCCEGLHFVCASCAAGKRLFMSPLARELGFSLALPLRTQIPLHCVPNGQSAKILNVARHCNAALRFWPPARHIGNGFRECLGRS